jgi:hypothetical protein
MSKTVWLQELCESIKIKGEKHPYMLRRCCGSGNGEVLTGSCRKNIVVA